MNEPRRTANTSANMTVSLDRDFQNFRIKIPQLEKGDFHKAKQTLLSQHCKHVK